MSSEMFHSKAYSVIMKSYIIQKSSHFIICQPFSFCCKFIINIILDYLIASFWMSIIMHIYLPILHIGSLTIRLTNVMQKCRKIYHIIINIAWKIYYRLKAMIPEIILMRIILLIKIYHYFCLRNQCNNIFSIFINIASIIR